MKASHIRGRKENKADYGIRSSSQTCYGLVFPVFLQSITKYFGYSVAIWYACIHAVNSRLYLCRPVASLRCPPLLLSPFLRQALAGPGAHWLD